MSTLQGGVLKSQATHDMPGNRCIEHVQGVDGGNYY